MLSIFEECRATQGSWRLLADVVLSAAKQQIHYLSTPVPKNAPLYAEIAASPRLARMLAVAVFGVALIAGVWVGGKPEDPEPWTVVRPEALFWFPTSAWEQYCSHALDHTGRPESARIAGVWVARKRKAPQSYRVVRSEIRLWFPTASSGQYRSEIAGNRQKQ